MGIEFEAKWQSKVNILNVIRFFRSLARSSTVEASASNLTGEREQTLNAIDAIELWKLLSMVMCMYTHARIHETKRERETICADDKV